MKRAELRIRLLRAGPGGECTETAAEHTVEHITVDFWRDQDVISAEALKALYQAIQAAEARAGQSKLVVHCTGGMGRTGTFITVDMAARELLRGERGVSIDGIISRLRGKRGSMVQHEAQYLFCHEGAVALSDMIAEQRTGAPQEGPEPMQLDFGDGEAGSSPDHPSAMEP